MARRAGPTGGGVPDFESSYPGARAALEEAVHALLSSGWDETLRRRAHEIATTLFEATRQAGWKEASSVLQALASLLALPLGDVISVREDLRNKLLELLDLLGDDPLAESA
jgi:hypothetical protein